jgi:hypothetical protein
MAVRVLLVLVAFAVLYGCDQESSPVEEQENQGVVQQAAPPPEPAPEAAPLADEPAPPPAPASGIHRRLLFIPSSAPLDDGGASLHGRPVLKSLAARVILNVVVCYKRLAL